MQLQTGFERKAFTVWLRTGRWLRPEVRDDPGRKFNPNHDPANGRFARSGGSFGGGGAGGSWGGDGGSGGGGGVTGSWSDGVSRRLLPTSLSRTDTTRPPKTISAKPAAAQPAAPEVRHVVRNGYDYTIDAHDNVQNVRGTVTLGNQPRSQRAQLEAGGSDRLPTDDGGHYIARRFNGPTDAFNHFAQNANFNRGGYRVMEQSWADAAAKRRKVDVSITPLFEGTSKRPTMLDVRYEIDGHPFRKRFRNQRREKFDGRH